MQRPFSFLSSPPVVVAITILVIIAIIALIGLSATKVDLSFFPTRTATQDIPATAQAQQTQTAATVATAQAQQTQTAAAVANTQASAAQTSTAEAQRITATAQARLTATAKYRLTATAQANATATAQVVISQQIYQSFQNEVKLITQSQQAFYDVTVIQPNYTIGGIRWFDGALVYLGYSQIDAGYILRKIRPEDIRVVGGSITIQLPAPEIITAALLPDKSKIILLDMPLGFALENSTLARAQQESVDGALRFACENSILDRANDNAETYFNRFLSQLNFSEIQIITSSPTGCP